MSENRCELKNNELIRVRKQVGIVWARVRAGMEESVALFLKCERKCVNVRELPSKQ